MYAYMNRKKTYPSPGPILEHSNEWELEKDDPEIVGEQSISGSASDPEEVEEEDTLEDVQDVGLYQDVDEEHPRELDIAKEIDKAEEHQLDQ